MTIDALIAELRAGSQQAFAKLVDDHLHKVVNICYRFAGNREEAEDLAQETFVEVYQSISRFRGDSSIATWIYRIAVRKSLDFLRKKNRVKHKGFFSNVIRLDDPFIEIASSSSERPDIAAEIDEQRRLLYRAISTLPQNQQTAFLLSKYDEMSYEEIAGILKLSVSAVTALIHRAKSKLNKQLNRYYEGFL